MLDPSVTPEFAPEPILLRVGLEIAFLPWSTRRLAATLVFAGGRQVTLDDDVSGNLCVTSNPMGDLIYEVPSSDSDYLGAAAKLLVQAGEADDVWTSADGVDSFARVGAWVMTLADDTSPPIHMRCATVADARTVFTEWTVVE